ncbi:hypothetical protein TVAG_257840 [Trichomonas vaginalis G3]|uniref:Uncharacterized protein n=1 Tax=Trichomonas vaginalis (strain ATCC PRA-98 / G3) TaxID=412133 RepID=A2F4G5_TRIV3|nr:hypothetical protein TVAG_257840 [Trichomonas vaginalis G3]|eukprot:XP_001313159.1 hypothetical protein [Trichomonas vaginalis G3]
MKKQATPMMATTTITPMAMPAIAPPPIPPISLCSSLVISSSEFPGLVDSFEDEGSVFPGLVDSLEDEGSAFSG